MQSMNQSLIALLAHQKITYQDAMALSSDPDDLSLKLRKLFPQIEERVRQGGDMAPSYSDFSQITELMDIKRLYEEQEVQWRQRLADKDEELDNPRTSDHATTSTPSRWPDRSSRRESRACAARTSASAPMREEDRPAPGAHQGAQPEASLAAGGPKAAAGQGGGFFKK